MHGQRVVSGVLTLFVGLVALSAVSTAQASAATAQDLVNAAKRGQVDTVRALIAQGIDVNAADKGGNTALMEAARTGKADVVKALLAAGAQVDARHPKKGYTALMRAAWAGQAATAKLLLTAGADVNAADADGKTAFQIALGNATANAHPDLITILAKAGVDLKSVRVHKKPPLIYAVDSLQDKTVRGLLTAGADPDVKDDKGRPALVLAAKECTLNAGVQMVANLLAGGGNASARDAQGKSALEYAVGISKLEYKKVRARDNCGKVVHMLVSKGADDKSISAARHTIFANGYALYDTLIVRARQRTASAGRTGKRPTRKAPRKARVAPPAGCPAKSAVRSLASSSADFKASGPLDLTAIRSSRALVKQDGQRLRVFLSNGAFSAQQMDNSFVLPLKGKSQFIVILNFMNGKAAVKPGKYAPAAGWGKPGSVSAELAVLGSKPPGTIITMVNASKRDAGSATIKAMNDSWVCGSFDVKGSLGETSGEFLAELE